MARDDEIRFHREQLERSARAFRSGFAEAALRRRAELVHPPLPGEYDVPEHFLKTLRPGSLERLAVLLGHVRAYRERLIGLTELDALVLYNGDEDALLVRDEFTAWALDHLRYRLSRKAPRDRGDPFVTWQRLMDEVGAWLENLVLQPGTGHEIPLGQIHRRLMWEAYQATWARKTVPDPHSGRLLVDHPDRAVRQGAQRTLDLFSWTVADAGRKLAERTPELAFGVTGGPDELQGELAAMAADLVEVRSLLVREYRPRERPVSLPLGRVAIWTWELGHRAGSVAVHLGAGDDGLGPMLGAVDVGLDGALCEPALPWLPLGPATLPWAVGLLRPVHRALVDAWLRTERQPDLEPSDEVGEGELVAAACEVIAEADEPRTDRDARTPRVPAVRTITLLALLERQFGCEIKQGKGSEVTVWRPGGRKFTLPGHRRNVHFPSHVVRGLLKAVGISPGEFAAVACKRP